MTEPILAVRGLKVTFPGSAGDVRAVRGVDYELRPGEVLGIVGESGSGKSASALAVTGLLPQYAQVEGSVLLDGKEIVGQDDEAMTKIRGKRIAVVFQDPLSALTPVYTIGDQISEAIRIHNDVSKEAARKRTVELLKLVGIPNAADRANAFPHEFSGGMRQRVMIAMALSCEPELIIADEPTTALDVTIQAQILELIKRLKQETGTSVILITHDLGVVAGMADHVIVMYAGKIFEQARTTELFATPGNPYTKGLLRSVPDPSAEQGKLYQIPGLPPDVAHLGPGCPFAPRCDRAEEICHREFPPFVQLNADHCSLCHFAEEVFAESGGKTSDTVQK